MGLSIASLRPVSGVTYTASTPMSYAVDNEAAVSDAFIESAYSTNASGGVSGAAPVVYANAKQTEVGHVDKMDAAMQIGKAYNDIAASFNGESTGYSSTSEALSYGMVGRTFDAYA